VAKPNYHLARKQKELARKARQQEKQQRRAARPSDADASTEPSPTADGTARREPTQGN
jgi:hypothetical protein